jgi:hypothetical protein
VETVFINRENTSIAICAARSSATARADIPAGRSPEKGSAYVLICPTERASVTSDDSSPTFVGTPPAMSRSTLSASNTAVSTREIPSCVFPGRIVRRFILFGGLKPASSAPSSPAARSASTEPILSAASGVIFGAL